MIDTSKKAGGKYGSGTNSDSSDLSDNEDQHMSDEDFPMSDDEMDAAVDSDQQQVSKWAATMAKYLRKSNDEQVLSKAKKDIDIERKKQQAKQQTYKFEIVGEKLSTNDALSDEKPTDLEMAKELIRQRALLKKERRKDILGLRVKPSIGDYEREKALKKIATRGTVQLFNAVRQQQRDISKKLEQAGKLEYKREKVLKNLSKKEFLDVLMNGPRAKSELVDNLVKKEETKDEVKSEENSSDEDEPKSTWGALRADFLTGKKSGWDKDDSEHPVSYVAKEIDGSTDSE